MPLELLSTHSAPTTSIASFCVFTDTFWVVPPVIVAQPVTDAAAPTKVSNTIDFANFMGFTFLFKVPCHWDAGMALRGTRNSIGPYRKCGSSSFSRPAWNHSVWPAAASQPNNLGTDYRITALHVQSLNVQQH
ncbi:protein of unknown function [Burkholderia multivorans]